MANALSLSLMQKCVRLTCRTILPEKMPINVQLTQMDWNDYSVIYCLLLPSLGCFNFGFFPLLFSSKNEVFLERFFSMAMLASILN